jgi:hypothetical protein
VARVPLKEAVKEISSFIENGGICANNAEYAAEIIRHHGGADANEIFQEASEQIAVLIASGIVGSEGLTIQPNQG